jgi:hypothetical protein
MSDELLECKRRLAELEDENAHLREASQTFGDLAERLNRELEFERRICGERRVTTRPTRDRRSGESRPPVAPPQS